MEFGRVEVEVSLRCWEERSSGYKVLEEHSLLLFMTAGNVLTCPGPPPASAQTEKTQCFTELRGSNYILQRNQMLRSSINL